MVAPMLSDLALAPLRAVDEAGLKDRVILETLTETRYPGGRTTEAWAAGVEQPGRLNPLALDSPLRANQPSAARKWTLALRADAEVQEGQRAFVRGTTNGVDWQRMVMVDEVVFPRSHQLRLVTLCSDTEANP